MVQIHEELSVDSQHHPCEPPDDSKDLLPVDPDIVEVVVNDKDEEGARVVDGEDDRKGQDVEDACQRKQVYANYRISGDDEFEVGAGFDVERKTEILQDEEMGNNSDYCSDEVGLNRVHFFLSREDEADGPEELRNGHEDQAEVLAPHSV